MKMEGKTDKELYKEFLQGNKEIRIFSKNISLYYSKVKSIELY